MSVRKYSIIMFVFILASLFQGMAGVRAQSVTFAPQAAGGASGSVAKLGFDLSNAAGVRDLQWTVTLPKGIEVVNNSLGQPQLLATQRAASHSFSAAVKPQPDGSTRVNIVGVSLSGALIEAGSGEIVSLAVKLAGSPGEYTVRTSNAHVSDASAADKACADASSAITVTSSPEEVAGLTLSQSQLTLKVQEAANLTATVLPETARDKRVTWQSGNSAVATVAAGRVTGVAPGVTTITATAANGKTATCEITVTAATVTAVTVTPANITLHPGATSTLSAVTTPVAAVPGTITWASSNDEVVTVAPSGRITAIGVGTVTITATTESGVSGQSTVTVENPKVTKLTMNREEATLIKGGTVALSVGIQPSYITSVALLWNSSNEQVATVSSKGVVTAVGTGTATITATEPNGVSATCRITVQDDALGVAVISADGLEAFQGDEATLTIRLDNPALLRDAQLSIVFPEGIAPLTNTDGRNAGSPRIIPSPRLANHNLSASYKGSTLTIIAMSLSGANIEGNDGVLLSVPVTVNAVPGTARIRLNNLHFSDAFGRDIKASDVGVDVLVKAREQYPAALSFEPAEMSLRHRASATLQPVFFPANAADKTLEWTSSAPDVVSVDATGKITATGLGSAVIKAQSPGGAIAECAVTVEEIAVTSVAVSPAQATLYLNDELTLSANILPADASRSDVTWTTSDAAVATIDAAGKIKAIAPGKVVFTATTPTGITGECKATVLYDPAKRSFVMNAASDDSDFSRLTAIYSLKNSEPVRDLQFRLVMPEKFTSAMINPASLVKLSERAAAHTVSVAKVADTPLAYQVIIVSLSGQPIKGVDGELCRVELDASTLGKAPYTLTATDFHISNTEGKDFTMPDISTSFGVEVAAVNLSPTTALLKIGETTRINATVLPENASDKAVTWTSSDETIATVDADGNVVALAKGEAVISATAGNVTSTCRITVDYADATDIVVTEGSGLGDIFADGLTLYAGSTQPISLTVVPSTASPVIAWASSDEAVVTADAEGLLTAAGVGTATITVSCGAFAKTFAVTVKPVEADAIALDRSEMALTLGESSQLTATLSPENVTDKTIVWTSSDETVATVTANGRVTATGVGTANITAANGSVSATCAVTVSYAETTDIVVAEDSELGDIFADGLPLYVGQSQSLRLTVLPSTANPSFSWTSSDEAIATVDDGVITAISEGVATITVRSGHFSKNISVSVSRREQSIIWEQIFGDLAEDDTVELTATATSGLPVEYRVVMGNATISGNTLHVENVGEIRIEASQQGDENYLPAKPVEKVLNVINGLSMTLPDGTQVRLNGNELTIESVDFALYDLKGQLIKKGRGPQKIILQPKRTYILKSGNKSTKFIAQ